ncbi:hypothetical protein HPB51_008923 [Rhipicephalus microplus]|uniref:Uncharacterized protein n=1 Tax=Rhipicephalus microplus TaxID=6941 RepID=A0A9J6E8B7_RHIMP|nr:hypothetical protein HPB51_008923 [Rhipicephalus microplus]
MPTVFQGYPAYMMPPVKRPRKEPAPRAVVPPPKQIKRKAQPLESLLLEDNVSVESHEDTKSMSTQTTKNDHQRASRYLSTISRLRSRVSYHRYNGSWASPAHPALDGTSCAKGKECNRAIQMMIGCTKTMAYCREGSCVARPAAQEGGGSPGASTKRVPRSTVVPTTTNPKTTTTRWSRINVVFTDLTNIWNNWFRRGLRSWFRGRGRFLYGALGAVGSHA